MNIFKNMTTNIEVYLESLAKKCLFSGSAKSLKILLAYPRYFLQVTGAYQGYITNKNHYPKSILLIAGLPKSGTTWLEELLVQFSGFSKVHLPEMAFHEAKTGGSHDLPLSYKMLSRLDNTLSVVKVHSNCSNNNINVLQQLDVNYVVMYRDLRDVAVSYYYFVSQRPWHPEFLIYNPVSIQEGLHIFAETLLPIYREWICTWQYNYNRNLGVEVRYEDLLMDTVGEFTRVVEHFELPHTDQQIEEIVSRYQVQRNHQIDRKIMTSAHFRKGIAGGWKEHFTSDLKKIYKEEIGEFLIEFDYEEDLQW